MLLSSLLVSAAAPSVQRQSGKPFLSSLEKAMTVNLGPSFFEPAPSHLF